MITEMIPVSFRELEKMRRKIRDLQAQVEARGRIITSLSAELQHVYRKINHGCIDASCKECDA